MIETKADLRTVYIREEIEASARTRRGFRTYCEIFDYDQCSLKGKKILDVGAGDSEFVQKARGFGANVIRLDPGYSDLRCTPVDTQGTVTGIAQDLPFGDNVFDETIVSYSFYWILTHREDAMLEMIRVTKPEGKIKIHPADPLKVFGKLPPNVSIIKGIAKGGDPTLVIKKTPAYSPREWRRAILDILPFTQQALPVDPTILFLNALGEIRSKRAKRAAC